MEARRTPSYWVLALCLFGSAQCVLLPAPAAAQQDAPTPARALSSVTVEAGDSWLGIRARMFPVEVLQELNPQVAARPLRPGDVIRAPYVHRAELDQANAAQASLRKDLDAAKARIEALETDLSEQTAPLPGLRAQIAALEATDLTWQRTVTTLAAVTLLLGAAIIVLAVLGLRLRSRLGDREQKLVTAQERYADLRKGLTDLELEVQRRMLRFLDAHGVRVVTEHDVDKAQAPVIDLAHKIRERHAG